MKDHMIKSKVFCYWNIQPRRCLNDWEIEEMGCLLEMLDNYCLGDGAMPDEMLWCLDEAKRYSVKSMCEVLGSSI